MRTDPEGRPLPPRLHYKGRAYYYVYQGRWENLGRDYGYAIQRYNAKMSPAGGMAQLVEEVYQRYEQKVAKGDLKASTVKQYQHYRHRIQIAFEDFSPNLVKPKHVSAFLDFHYGDTPGQHNLVLTVLREVFRCGVRWGLCETNPAREVEQLKPRVRHRYITDSEYMAIRGAAKPHIRLIMDMSLITGQRIGDVLHIKQADIGEDGIFFQQQKTRKRLLIEMTPELSELVKEARGLSKVSGLYLFGKHGKPYGYHLIRRHWLEACKAAGVKDANLHDLRRKALTDADADGLDAQKMAGHTSRAMTEKYLQLLRTERVTPGKVARLRK